MSRGSDTYNIDSYREFCEELGVQDPLDKDFIPRCSQFFKEKGHSQDDANSICYVGFQQKFKNMKNDLDDDELTEEKSAEALATRARKVFTSNMSKLGLSPTGRKKKATGRGEAGESYVEDRSESFEDSVEMLMKQGYPKEDAEKIAADITWKIQDRIDKGVAGNVFGQIPKDDDIEMPDEMPMFAPSTQMSSARRKLEMESFADKLDGIFLTEKKKKKKKKKTSKKKSSRRVHGAGGYPYERNEGGDLGGDVGMGGGE
jgi:hypothetical protein